MERKKGEKDVSIMTPAPSLLQPDDKHKVDKEESADVVNRSTLLDEVLAAADDGHGCIYANRMLHCAVFSCLSRVSLCLCS